MYYILHFVFGCILPQSAFSLNTGFKHNAGKNLFGPVFVVMDTQGAVHQISKYCFLLLLLILLCSLHPGFSSPSSTEVHQHTCTSGKDNHFVLTASLLDFSIVFASGFNHVGNGRPDGPRGTSLTATLSQPSNFQLLRGLVLLPSQACIPAASSSPCLVLT